MTRLAAFAVGLSMVLGVAAPGLANPAQLRPYHAATLDLWLKHIAVVGDSYTTGTDEGGLGPNAWTARSWKAFDTAPYDAVDCVLGTCWASGPAGAVAVLR